MGVRWCLVVLVGCSIPLGKSAREDCEAINQAAEAYFARCGGAPAHEADCTKVWDGDWPDGYTLEACLAAWNNAACAGEINPPECPKTWDKVPWES